MDSIYLLLYSEYLGPHKNILEVDQFFLSREDAVDYLKKRFPKNNVSNAGVCFKNGHIEIHRVLRKD